MSKTNREKTKQLGMPQGTARNKLHKSIMFSMVKQLGLDKCYRCKEVIDNIDQLSVEHKTSWLHSENPVELYFDLENISFSHLSCNCSAAKRTKKYETEDEARLARNERDRNRRAKQREDNPELVKQKRKDRYLRNGK